MRLPVDIDLIEPAVISREPYPGPSPDSEIAPKTENAGRERTTGEGK
jgi:hypothetical protein